MCNQKSNFCHIHMHTDFSLLDGFGQVKEYAKKANENGIKYLCVTDHGIGGAYPRMIEECEKYNLKPIFGCEIYTNNFHHLVPKFKDLSDEEKKLVNKNNHLLLVAKTNKGYENLVKIISHGWINGFYRRPRVSWQYLKEHSEGLICCSACLASQLSQLILQDKIKEAALLAKEFKEVWPNDYYIELMMINIEEQNYTNKVLLKIADKLNIPVVLTNDVHYCEQEDSYNQEIQLLLNSKSTINNRGTGLEIHTNDLWYKTEDELDELWLKSYKDDIPEPEYKEAKLNTVRICESCNVQIDTSPKFPVVENAKEIMLEKCLFRLKKMGKYNDPVYQQRLLKEYDMICEKGYASYFMVVDKIISFAKSKNCPIGAARGSGAGSLICYLLGITQVDPIKYGLLFERFLSHSRGGKFARLQFKDSDEIK